MIGHRWPYERKWPSPHLPKRKLGPPIQKVPKKFEVFPALLQGTKKTFSPHKKKYLWMGGRAYTMENKDTNTLPESYWVRGRQVKHCGNYNRNHLFVCLRFVSLFFIQEVFKSHLEKITPS